MMIGKLTRGQCRPQQRKKLRMTSPLSLNFPPVATLLERLHSAARGDWKHRIVVAPRYLMSRLTGVDLMARSGSTLRHAYSSVTRAQGRFLYLLARATQARRIVEFGSSFGISTIYLAAAARDNGGSVVTTEIEPSKVVVARENLRAAQLEKATTVLEGDAIHTLADVEGPVDLLFLDGAKELYLPVLELLRQRLHGGAVVVADNVDMPSARAYVGRVRAPGGDFMSSTLFGGRTEVSYVACSQAGGLPNERA